jgi:hypothetical protein
VSATATEADGRSLMNGHELFEPPGGYTGVKKLDKELLEDCIQRVQRFPLIRSAPRVVV